ncbi:MAG TPA: hypothetical protein VGD58_06465, partial [Herpetosiphonaceae bacterium]
MQRRTHLILLLMLACVLLLPQPSAAHQSGWLRVGNSTPAHLAVRSDGAGNLEIWSADIDGFSVISADGAIRRQFRWPRYSEQTAASTTLRIAVTGTPPAAWTIGDCCIGKSGPKISVLVPGADRTREANLSPGFDVGRAGEGAAAIAVDALGHPWLATTDGLWRMVRGWNTPLVVGDDLWIEVTDAQGRRIYGIASIDNAPDGKVWVTEDNTDRLLQFTIDDEQTTLVGSYSQPRYSMGTVSQLVFDSGGKLYYLVPELLFGINPDGSVLPIVSAEDLGGRLDSAAFIGGTLWVATTNGLYRRSTVPAPEIAPLMYGAAEYNSVSYDIPAAPGIFMGDLTNAGRSFDPASYWYRTDRPIAEGRAGRSFYWGPSAWTITREPYRDAPFGTRRVIYFDKARMEVTNPAQPPVTNGLLVVELVTGRAQLGDTTFEQRAPAAETVAGDPIAINADAPTYAAFGGVTMLTPGATPQRLGQVVSATIDKQGRVGANPALARPETRIVTYDTVTGHNIPLVFAGFMQQRGLIDIPGGSSRVEQLIDPLVAIGRPISEPYWLQTNVGGARRWVLTQLFERRVLTYTPDNPAAFQVEMGNVG